MMANHHAGATEFYSWTDASGAVVITDDPKQVPPTERRQNFMTHHLPALPASDLPSNDQVRSSQSEQSVPSNLVDRGNLQGDDTLPDILLDQPGQAFQQAYVWVPLQTPYVWGNQTFTGFWSHRRVASPKKAFRAYLRGHGQSLQTDPTGTPSGSSASPGSPTGRAFRDTVYEQVRREREAIQQRGGFLYGSDAAPHSSSGSHSPSSGSPASNGSGAAGVRH